MAAYLYIPYRPLLFRLLYGKVQEQSRQRYLLKWYQLGVYGQFDNFMDTPTNDATLELCLPANAASTPHREADPESVVIHLFDQHQARLAHYILGFGLPLHDAEDIVQETFLSLFHHLRRGRPRWNLSGWLFRVAHNLALKRRRVSQTIENGLDHEALLSAHRDRRHDAEEHVIFTQTQRQLRAVFDALPEIDRQCLQLRAEGLKYREIARVLGVSLGAVSMSLSRSLARMTRATGGE